jgi:hypothetical protein
LPTGELEKMEEISAINVKDCIQKTKTRQMIYLSGIVNMVLFYWG